jgi:DNA-binding transcriptional LysR family regulator
VSSISAMSQLVEDGLGIATLPAAVLERLRQRRPLKGLQASFGLSPLPVHLSWRVDPTSAAPKTLVDSLLQHLGVDAVHRKRR